MNQAMTGRPAYWNLPKTRQRGATFETEPQRPSPQTFAAYFRPGL